MLTTPQTALTIVVEIKHGEADLWFATSRDMKGLLVAEKSRDEAVTKTRDAIRNLYAACDIDVEVSHLASVMRGDEIFQVTQAS